MVAKTGQDVSNLEIISIIILNHFNFPKPSAILLDQKIEMILLS
jgi:hypothetical protein